MIRLGADEDFDQHIVRGLRRRVPHVDIVTVQDAELRGASDPSVLSWAALSRRVLLTHDASTMTNAAYQRIDDEEDMPGLIVVPQWLSIGDVIGDLALVVECSEAEDWHRQVRFLPLA